VVSFRRDPFAQENKTTGGRTLMWQQYKRTLTRIQIVIVLATIAVFVGMGQRWFMTVVFFAMMQVGAVVGAWWGDRLKRRLATQF
jgi:hypothetical protein